MKTIAVINHKDSFIFNLVHILKEIPGVSVSIVEYADDMQIDLSETDLLVLSPGPGEVSDYPASLQLIQEIEQRSMPLPIVGICLGHQQLGYLYGMSFVPCDKPMHGIPAEIVWQNEVPTWGVCCEEKMTVGRYHSWSVAATPHSCEIEVDALSLEDHLVMALHHKKLPFYGLQFHPESILSPRGASMIRTAIRHLLSIE